MLQQFDKQRDRGTEGFGLFDGQFKHMVRASKENKILKWLCRYDSNVILFHHRKPTSTINVKKAAHPFSTRAYFGNVQYITVHNGYISNARKLKLDHEELGIKYQSTLRDKTFNDSEALAWDLALTFEGQQEKLKAQGGIAFVTMKLVDGKLTTLYFGRNRFPLNMFRDKENFSLSSEGAGEPIEEHTLYTYSYGLNRLTKKPFPIDKWVAKPYTPSGTYPYGGRGSDHHYEGYHWGNMSQWTPNSKGPGDWLPEKLRESVKNYLPLGDDPFIDFDRDGNPIFEIDFDYEIPITEGYTKRGSGILIPSKSGFVSDDVVTDEEEEALETYTPPSREVQSKVMGYLSLAGNKFEIAYGMAEADYLMVTEENNITALKEGRLLEKVLQTIMNDPENIDEHSVSSIGENVCQTNQI